MPTKIKRKGFGVLFLVLLVSLGAVANHDGDALFQEAQNIVNETRNYEKAITIYDEFIEKYPNHPRIPDALFASAMLLPDKSSASATIFHNYSSISHGSDDELLPSVLTKEERLWRLYNEFPDHHLTTRSKYFLAEFLKNKGEIEKAADFYVDFIYNERGSFHLFLPALDFLIDYFTMENEPDRALEILEYASNKPIGLRPFEKQMKLGDILLAKDDLKGAEEAYNKAIEMYQEEYKNQLKNYTEANPSTPYKPLDQTELYQREILHKLTSKSSGRELYGQVTINGKPLPGVEVVLWNKPNAIFFRTPHESELISQFTNLNGEFRFPIGETNEYQVGIKLNSTQMTLVENYTLEILNSAVFPGLEPKKVEFNFSAPIKLINPNPNTLIENEPFIIEWEPYPNASFYCVMVDPLFRHSDGSSSTGGIPRYTENTSITIDQIPSDIGSISLDLKGTHPSYFLAPDALQIRVVACDIDGKPLANSKGLYFGKGQSQQYVFDVKRDLKEEEKLIIDYKFDEAVISLENRLAANPNDTYALNLLSKIYYAGTYYTGRDSDSKAHTDMSKAREMLERLVAIEPTARNLRNLSNLYSNQDEPKHYELYMLLETRGELLPKECLRLAEYSLWYEDNFQKAIDYSLTSHKVSLADTTSFPQNLVALYVLLGESDKALVLFENWQITDRREEKLLELLDRYRSFEGESSDYLSVVSESFKDCRKIWQEKNSPHSQFLYTLSELIKPNRYRERLELRSLVQSFGSTYGESAPLLSELLTAFADYFYI